MRIRDPEDGLLRPDAFLDVAEETGLLIAVDEQVMADAVQRASDWQARLPAALCEVAINVTARHLADARFPRAVIEQLDAKGVPHRNLQIEVTERVLMEASNSAITGLRMLRDAGVQVGLDDFGTGYSSLGYLRRFPLDFVKIDRRSSRPRAHRRATGDRRGHRSGWPRARSGVVAEGVETQGQLHVLESLDCDRMQGFLLAPSGEASVVEELVLAGTSPSLRRRGE